MGMTMVEKVLARTSGYDVVRVGEILECQVDQVVQVDMAFTLSELIPTRVKAPERVVLIFDHAIPAPSVKDADGMIVGRRLAKKFGIKLVEEMYAFSDHYQHPFIRMQMESLIPIYSI